MPFYSFTVRTPTHVMTAERVELADSAGARVEAAKYIGRLLHDHPNQIWADRDWSWT